MNFNICNCTRSGNRTRTAIAGHRILSPACLPIPPSELIINNKIKIKKYYYSKNNIKERRANNLYDILNNRQCNIIFIRMSNSTYISREYGIRTHNLKCIRLLR